MKSCYDLTRELIGIMGDIDRTLEKRAKAKLAEEWLMLDADITRLEGNMYELINILKSIEVKGGR